jgi:thiol-disulfide isomerase/thioredoxin
VHHFLSRDASPGDLTVTATARTGWLALFCLALTGFGCGHQDYSATNTSTQPDRGTPKPSAVAGPSSEAPAPDAAPGPALSPVSAVAAPAPAPGPAAPSPGSADQGEVTLEKVTYDALLRRIAENPRKPKYTIVDAWATWCGPCKENFPHLVEMHRKYAEKGLAVMSISFDDPANPKQVEDARAFLRQMKATCTNFVLDEGEGVGFEKFGVNGIPAVFLYGPDGKEMRRFTMDDSRNQFTYEQVEKAVVALLEGNPS